MGDVDVPGVVGVEGAYDQSTKTRWRGGREPPAPEFEGEMIRNPKELEDYLTEYEVYKIQIKPYLPEEEWGLRLYRALKGKARTKFLRAKEPAEKYAGAEGHTAAGGRVARKVSARITSWPTSWMIC